MGGWEGMLCSTGGLGAGRRGEVLEICVDWVGLDGRGEEREGGRGGEMYAYLRMKTFFEAG